MLKSIAILILLTYSTSLLAQVKNDTIDYKYLEDQLYFTVSYNILNNKSKEDDNSLFSGGFSLGFSRDIPINKQRNIGFGIGVNYCYSSYNNNITFYEDDNDDIVETYNSTKFRNNLVEFPIEFRWRTSTPTKFSFWRIYGGVKFGYSFASKTIVESSGDSFKLKNIDITNRFQSGIILSAGYSTWNIYCYYGLTPLFNAKDVNGEDLNVKDFKLGLKFYIL